MANPRLVPIGYHGVRNAKFAPTAGDAYAADFILMPNAKSLSFTSVLEATEVYGDNRLLVRVPNDKGYTADFGCTAPIPDLEKAAGYAMEGASGVIGANVSRYLYGAMYYEYIEIRKDQRESAVRVWAYNVGIGKGTLSHATDAKSIELGDYKYPVTISGDTLMDSQGAKPWMDDLGMGRVAFFYTSRPGDEGYETFGDTVPMPKVKAVAPPSGS